jgi:amino acid efflux transporter
MALSSRITSAGPPHLTTSRGAALYIGALLGPGLLLLPGLAAAEAGPASILAWLALLVLSGLFAAVFAAWGLHRPSAGGVIGYVTAGLGPRAGLVTGWAFLAGVVCGAPLVCLIGASYVAELTGGGPLARAAVAAALLLTVVGLAAGGLRASAAAQLILVGVLTVVAVVASAGSAGSARAGNWTPFAPHGFGSIGSAAATLMFSFVGWEAVAPLTTRFANPRRQLPRVVAITLAVTSALYLGLAVATISVLGRRAATDVPLADLLSHAIGAAGRDVAVVAAIALTLGTTNAYINGAATMAGQLAPVVADRAASRPLLRLVGAITAVGLLLITLHGLRIVSTTALVAVPTALFLTVYLGAMIAAARVLHGLVRLAAVPAALAVVVMLAFCGWALAVPAAVALVATLRRGAFARRRGLRGGLQLAADACRPVRRCGPGRRRQRQLWWLPARRASHRPVPAGRARRQRWRSLSSCDGEGRLLPRLRQRSRSPGRPERASGDGVAWRARVGAQPRTARPRPLARSCAAGPGPCARPAVRPRHAFCACRASRPRRRCWPSV